MYIKNEVKISDSEWLIMKAIWEKSPAYMGDIVSALAHTPWRRTTIQTMVARLVAKKAIGSDHREPAFLYYPLISKEDADKMYTKAFVERVYSNDAAELVKALIDGEYLSAAQKKEIKKLL